MIKTYRFYINVNSLQNVDAHIYLPVDTEQGLPVEATGKFRYTGANQEKIQKLARKARRPTGSRQAITEKQMGELGDLLYEALFQENVRYIFEYYLKQVRADNQAIPDSSVLRIELEFDRELTEASSLPWEFLRASINGVYYPIATESLVNFVRVPFHDDELSNPRLKPGETIRIALADADIDDDMPELRGLDKDRHKGVKEILQGLAQETNGKIALMEPVIERADLVKIKDFLDAHKQDPPHIFHFIGHGKFTEENSLSGEVGLVKRDFQYWITGQKFAQWLSTIKNVPVVVLQTCESAASSSTQADSGIASPILGRGSNIVIAMQYEISKPAASIFAEKFYSCLAQDQPVEKAVQEGRMQLGKDNTRDFATPVLLTNLKGQNLFTREPMLDDLAALFTTVAAMNKDSLHEFQDDLRGNLKINKKLPDTDSLPEWIAALDALNSQGWNRQEQDWDRKYQATDRMHPLQWLVEKLAKDPSVDSDLAGKLRKWSDDYTQKMVESDQPGKITTGEALKSLRVGSPAPRSQAVPGIIAAAPAQQAIKPPGSTLLVTIWHERDNEDYQIRADYWEDSWYRLEIPPLVVKLAVSREEFEKELEARLTDLFGSLRPLQLSRKKTRVEFRVPPELLSFCYVKVPNGAGAYPVGGIFPLVARLDGRDRIPYDDFVGEWEENSSRLSLDCCKKLPRDVRKMLPAEVSFSDKLANILFPVLTCEPPGAPVSWLNKLYEYGIPVALWPRTMKDSEVSVPTFDSLYQQLLQGQQHPPDPACEAKLQDLPELLQQERKQAFSNADTTHASIHLVLLWDDAGRLKEYDKRASLAVSK